MNVVVINHLTLATVAIRAAAPRRPTTTTGVVIATYRPVEQRDNQLTSCVEIRGAQGAPRSTTTDESAAPAES